MAVKILSVDENSLCGKKDIAAGCVLLSVNGHNINDVLDYRFYGTAKRIHLVINDLHGENRDYHFKTTGNVDELGLNFETYLMDKQHSCKNKCIFCFVDQMPQGMRDSLYFKDDDSRLSFFFGNYVTLTNMKDADIDRLIEMHISPVNISVHTMNPELRVKMMKNPDAGKVLSYIKKLADNNIEINAQFVLCPGYNDGDELVYSLNELYKIGKNIVSVAAVPVGLTKHRDGLCSLECYNSKTAGEVIDIIDKFNTEHYDKLGRNFVFAADEFYLKADRKMPECEYYEDFRQLDDGVGLWSNTREEFLKCLDDADSVKPRRIAIITGVAASPLMEELATALMKKFSETEVVVKTVVNDFFGHEVTVAGLVTAGDIINQVTDLSGFDEAFIPSVMLRDGEDKVFLDDLTLSELSEKLNVKITPVTNSGRDLFNKISGNKGKESV